MEPPPPLLTSWCWHCQPRALGVGTTDLQGLTVHLPCTRAGSPVPLSPPANPASPPGEATLGIGDLEAKGESLHVKNYVY